MHLIEQKNFQFITIKTKNTRKKIKQKKDMKSLKKGRFHTLAQDSLTTINFPMFFLQLFLPLKY